MYLVEDLYKKHGNVLNLQLVAGKDGLKRRIKVPEVHRPGLGLAGFLKSYAIKRILVFGKVEMEYLRALTSSVRKERLKALLNFPTPAVLIARGYRPTTELIDICNENKLPLFRSSLVTMTLLNQMMVILNDEFAPSSHFHGTFVEVFGIGVLIQGGSAAGKSEAALGLIERGHRLVSDDLVKIKKRENSYLEGSGVELTRYHMEIRGIGIINVANLYGAVCVCESKTIDMVVRLEAWNDNHFYDRIGVDQKFCEILGIQVPFYVLPVKPGRDVVLLLETLALNHRLKAMGYHSAQEFNNKLMEKLKNSKRRR